MELLGLILVAHRFIQRFPDQLERHARGCRDGIESRPARLIDYRNVLHFERNHFSIGRGCQAVWWHCCHPIQPRLGDGWVKIMDLIVGDRRPPKKCPSYVGERPALRCAARPVLSRHESVVCGRSAKSDSVPLIVRSQACEGAAPRHTSPEMIDMRRLQIGARGLIVTAVLIEPRDWIRIGSAVRCVPRQVRLLATADAKRHARSCPSERVQESSSRCTHWFPLIWYGSSQRVSARKRTPDRRRRNPR